MRSRCPGSIEVGRAWLEGHSLEFAGYSSRWRGGVATVEPRAGSEVFGSLYLLTEGDVARLDRYEGHPRVYERREVVVVDDEGAKVSAFAYFLNAPASVPAAQYMLAIERGYERHGIDPKPILDAYLRSLDRAGKLDTYLRVAGDVTGRLQPKNGRKVSKKKKRAQRGA